jgi:hypothetical protein
MPVFARAGDPDARRTLQLITRPRSNVSLGGKDAPLLQAIADLHGKKLTRFEAEFYREHLLLNSAADKTSGAQAQLVGLLNELPLGSEFDMQALRAVTKSALSRDPDHSGLAEWLSAIGTLERFLVPAASAFGFLLSRDGARRRCRGQRDPGRVGRSPSHDRRAPPHRASGRNRGSDARGRRRAAAPSGCRLQRRRFRCRRSATRRAQHGGHAPPQRLGRVGSASRMIACASVFTTSSSASWLQARSRAPGRTATSSTRSSPSFEPSEGTDEHRPQRSPLGTLPEASEGKAAEGGCLPHLLPGSRFLRARSATGLPRRRAERGNRRTVAAARDCAARRRL